MLKSSVIFMCDLVGGVASGIWTAAFLAFVLQVLTQDWSSITDYALMAMAYASMADGSAFVIRSAALRTANENQLG